MLPDENSGENIANTLSSNVPQGSSLNIQQMLVPDECVFINSGGYVRKFLVLHKTAGGSSAQNVAAWFQSGAGGARTSTHYIVGLDGTIVQTVRERDGAGGNCCLESGHAPFWPTDINLNLISFSIECVDPTSDNSTPMPDAQKRALFPLIRDICTRNNIPMRPADAHGGIAGHYSIAPLSRARCPGNYPWDDLWTYLAGGGSTMLELTDAIIQIYFTDGGDHAWKCRKNGVLLFGSNLTFYRSRGGPALFGLPLANEIYLPQYPNTAIVPCERALIVYDPERKIDNPPIEGQCYLLHIDCGIGQELLAQSAQSTIQQLIKKMQQIHALSETT
jgi:N-acetyl-anhydromuramyl-L-alanine amidase AmpD